MKSVSREEASTRERRSYTYGAQGSGGGGAPACRHRLTAARLKISWPAYRATHARWGRAVAPRRPPERLARSPPRRHSLRDNLAVPTPAHNNNTRDLYHYRLHTERRVLQCRCSAVVVPRDQLLGPTADM
ncbi:unnamed protein product [Spodoptera exigua]|nr:unnamed protein product [Spodoptera exigua]